MKERDRGIVYSSAHGRMCPECGRPVKECVCRQKKAVPVDDAVLRIGRETKGRKGKGVTVITGFPGDEAELKELERQLKAKCGAGGTAKNGVIEIQGDHRHVLLEELSNRGWKVKLAGGWPPCATSFQESRQATQMPRALRGCKGILLLFETAAQYWPSRKSQPVCFAPTESSRKSVLLDCLPTGTE